MKKIIIALSFLVFNNLFSQKDETIKWINENSIKIEDANPDTELLIFGTNTPSKFANAQIFGFGEASHNTKEFFDIKAKFFKHLVKTQDVKIFIMEDAYQTESGINEWISGGEGDIKTIGRNFRIGFWNRKEVINLLQWMRDYNMDKSKKEQIRFYGMDVKYGDKLNIEIRNYIKEHEIVIDESLLKVIDSCANKKVEYYVPSDWASVQIPKLKKVEQILEDFNKGNFEIKRDQYNSIRRSLSYLIKYTQLVENPGNDVRDLKMFENVKWIIDHETDNGKVFIWAHNEHINKKEMYYTGSGKITLGAHLKKYYNDDYYSVGFDFGIGEIRGYVAKKGKPNYWKTYEIEKPFRKTYAHTLVEANDAIYFIDMENALNSDSTNFFAIKKKHLLVGGGGYQPKPLHRILVSKIYTETYDGLIFVRNISPVTW